MRGKRQINQRLKTGLQVICIILAITSFSLLGYTIFGTKTAVQENPIYTYSNAEEVNYKVNLNKSQIYDDQALEEGTYYLMKYINNIQVTFKEDFKGSKETNISGNYKIVAILRGYIMQDNNKVTVWSKEFEVVPTTTFSESSQAQNIKKTIQVDVQKYNTFVEQLRQQENINLNSELILKMEGNKVVAAPQEDIEIPILTTLTIPMGEDYFKIEKSQSEPIEATQTEQIVVTKGVNKLLVAIYAIIGILGVLVCILLGKLTQGIRDEKKKEIKSALREYSSRMVQIEALNESVFRQIYKLKSIEDIAKVAEEIEKPIMYIRENGRTLLNLKFYVADVNILYKYEIKKDEVKEEKEEKIIENDIYEIDKAQ